MDNLANRNVGGFKWIFNSLMVWGAMLGFVIFGALDTIGVALNHEGPGYVTYEEPDRTELVSESKFKRNRFAMGGMMLALGVGFWVGVAKYANDDKKNLKR